MVDQFGRFGADEGETFDEASASSGNLVALLALAGIVAPLVALSSLADCRGGTPRCFLAFPTLRDSAIKLSHVRQVEAIRPGHCL